MLVPLSIVRSKGNCKVQSVICLLYCSCHAIIKTLRKNGGTKNTSQMQISELGFTKKRARLSLVALMIIIISAAFWKKRSPFHFLLLKRNIQNRTRPKGPMFNFFGTVRLFEIFFVSKRFLLLFLKSPSYYPD